MKAKKIVNRQVRVLEARELMSVVGGLCGCGSTTHQHDDTASNGGMPPGAVGLPSLPPNKNGGNGGMPPGAVGLPSLPPAKQNGGMPDGAVGLPTFIPNK